MKIHIDKHQIIKQPLILYAEDIDFKLVKNFHVTLNSAIQNGQQFFPIMINSMGGDVYALFDLVSQIRHIEEDMPVLTIVHGCAMSAGAALACLGTIGYRYVSPFATFMIHDTWESASEGSTHELQANSKETQRINELIWRTMENHIEQPKGYFNTILDQHKHTDVYLKPKEILKHKLCDYIGIPTYNISCKVEQEIL